MKWWDWTLTIPKDPAKREPPKSMGEILREEAEDTAAAIETLKARFFPPSPKP